MKLLLRRDQKSGMLTSKITFTLSVRAELTEAEKENVKKYKLGDTVLYAEREVVGGSGLLGMASRLAFKAINLTIQVDDLAKGKVIEAKDIVEMLAIEEHVRTAAENFKAVLDAAAKFGGEEVIEL